MVERFGTICSLDPWRTIYGCQWTFFFDYFFCSADLIKCLEPRNITSGPVHVNRSNFPANLKPMSLVQGEIKTWQSRNLEATAWKDRQIGSFLSPNTKPEPEITAVEHRVRGRRKCVVQSYREKLQKYKATKKMLDEKGVFNFVLKISTGNEKSTKMTGILLKMLIGEQTMKPVVKPATRALWLLEIPDIWAKFSCISHWESTAK